mgnify:CR=1 FL=1
MTARGEVQPAAVARRSWLLPGLVAATAIAVRVGLAIGSAAIDPLRAWAALLADPAESRVAMVVQEIRLPRVLMGLLAAAIAAGRAEGLRLEEAIERAQEFVQGAITSSLKVGEGQPVPDRSFKGVP